MATAQVRLSPRSICILGNQFSPGTGIHNSFGTVAISPQPLELQMIFTLCIGGVVNGFSNRGFTGFSLIGFHNLTLRCLELVTLVVFMAFFPLVKATGYFILNISANYPNPWNFHFTEASIKSWNGFRISYTFPLFIPDLTGNVAATPFSTALLPGVLSREHLIKLGALLESDIVVFNKISPNHSIPSTPIAIPLTAKGGIAFDKGKRVFAGIWIICPNPQGLT